jgi:GH18 family chitinase
LNNFIQPSKNTKKKVQVKHKVFNKKQIKQKKLKPQNKRYNRIPNNTKKAHFFFNPKTKLFVLVHQIETSKIISK